MPLWMSLLAAVLQLAPTVASEVEGATEEHWGKDHTQQVVQGIGHLQNILNSVKSVAGEMTQAETPPAAQPSVGAHNFAPGTPTE